MCVDGVALAPHRQVDVKALDVDFYVSVLSNYGVTIAPYPATLEVVLAESCCTDVTDYDYLTVVGLFVVQGVWASHRTTLCLVPNPRADRFIGTLFQSNGYTGSEA